MLTGCACTTMRDSHCVCVAAYTAESLILFGPCVVTASA